MLDAKELERTARRLVGEVAGYLRDIHGTKGLDEVLGRGASGDTTRRADRLAEDFLIDLVKAEGLDVLIVSEEKGIVRISDSPNLILLTDPLDGSLNYVLGIPVAAVSVVFYSIDKPYLSQALSGAVASVFVREIYSFDEENVYVNGVIMHERRELESGIATVYTNDPSLFVVVERYLHGRYRLGSRIRVLGSAALESTYAAIGRFSLFIHNTGKLRNLDIACGYAIAKRFGLPVIDVEGNEIDGRTDGISRLRSMLIGGKEILDFPKFLRE